LRHQSQPCTITVCDCHPSDKFALSEMALPSIDRMYRWSHNLGSYSRYVPIGAYDHEYTLFLDDDMLPGRKCVEHFLKSAKAIRHFGVLGQLGRIVGADGSYFPRNIQRMKMFVEVDVLVRGYFIRTSNLFYLLRLREIMGSFDAMTNDDLALCISLRLFGNLPLYLTPSSKDRETLMNKEDLDDEFALSRRPEHLRRRNEFLRRAITAGWVPKLARGLEKERELENSYAPRLTRSIPFGSHIRRLLLSKRSDDTS